MSSLIQDKRILTYALVAIGLAMVAGVMVAPSVAYADGGDDHHDHHHHEHKHHEHKDHEDHHHHHHKHHKRHHKDD